MRHRLSAACSAILLVTAVAGCGGGGGGGTNAPPPSPTPSPTSAQRDAFGCIVGSWRNVGGVPAETRFQTDHFALHWNGATVTEAEAAKAGQTLESAYAYYAGTIGFRPPDCESVSKTRINVNVAEGSGTSNADGVNIAGNRNGVGFMDVNLFGLVTDRLLAHELVHVFQSVTPGWPVLPASFRETHANFMVAQLPAFRDDVDCSEDAINIPHLAHGNSRTRYCGWQFWDHLAQKSGYGAVNDIWTRANAATVDQYDALMKNMGWSIAQLNDELAGWALRNVTWDYKGPDGFDRGALFRARYGDHQPDTAIPFRARRLTTLEPIDLANRRFAVPFTWAPQRWGYNLVRLEPDAGARQITIAFRGVDQAQSATATLPGAVNEPRATAAPASGWRWSVVVVDAQGAARYARVMQGGDESASVPLQADDRAAYLVVMAAPTVFQHVNDDQPYYSVYRYPWMVQIDGAMPWGQQAGAPDRIPGGRRHANGNGWVGPEARVDAGVYVGPFARVYGGTVTGRARIEDHAMVVAGTIGDNAGIDALTVLAGSSTVTGNARIGSVAGTIAGNGFALSGTAQLLGDIQIAGDVRQIGAPTFGGFARGVYYGMVLQSDGDSVARGANRTEPVAEVTARAVYRWR